MKPASERVPPSRVPGRPRLDPVSQRVFEIHVRYGLEELDLVTAKARALRVPLATFVRACSLGAKLPTPIPEPNIQYWRELAHLAGNLNQWMHAVNSGTVQATKAPDLLEVQRAVHKLRLDLLGKRT